MQFIEQTSKELLSNHDMILNIFDDNYTIDNIYENSIVDMHESFNSLMEAMTIYELSEKANIVINEAGFIKKFFDGLLNILKKAWGAIKSIFSKSKESLDKKFSIANKKLFEIKQREVSLDTTIQITLKNAYDDMDDEFKDVDMFFKFIDRNLKDVYSVMIRCINSIKTEDKEGFDRIIEDFDELYEKYNDKYFNKRDDLTHNFDGSIVKKTMSCGELFDKLSDIDKYKQMLSDSVNRTKKLFDKCEQDIKRAQRELTKLEDRSDYVTFIKPFSEEITKFYGDLSRDILCMNRFYSININRWYNIYNLAIDSIVDGKDSIVIDFKGGKEGYDK